MWAEPSTPTCGGSALGCTTPRSIPVISSCIHARARFHRDINAEILAHPFLHHTRGEGRSFDGHVEASRFRAKADRDGTAASNLLISRLGHPKLRIAIIARTRNHQTKVRLVKP